MDMEYATYFLSANLLLIAIVVQLQRILTALQRKQSLSG